MPATTTLANTPTTSPVDTAAGAVQIGHGTSSERPGDGRAPAPAAAAGRNPAG